MIRPVSVCPGCGIDLPDDGWTMQTAYEASPECLRLSGEVVAYNHANPESLAVWHQVCVDAYGGQHVGPDTAPITVSFALNGLYLVLERGFTGIQAREAHGYLANTVAPDSWPRFTPPADVGDITVLDVALAASPQEHIGLVRQWGRAVWVAWSHTHDRIAEMTEAQLTGWHPARSA